MNNKYKIYLDMDGCITDFNRAYLKLTGKDLKRVYHTGLDFWMPISRAGIGFWENIEWEDEGKELWKYISTYNPTILSAPSRTKSSIIGKTRWLERELPGIPFILTPASKKQMYANENSILIDDRVKNIEEWNQNNGIGILHTTVSNTITQLKTLGL